MERICQQSRDSSLASAPRAKTDTPRAVVALWVNADSEALAVVGEDFYDAAVDEDTQLQRLTFRHDYRPDLGRPRPYVAPERRLRHVDLERAGVESAVVHRVQRNARPLRAVRGA